MKPIFKKMVITAGLEIIALSQLGRLMPQAAGRGVIFTLHHVRPAMNRPYEPNALLSITPDFLDQAIQEAISKGYTPVALTDLPELLAKGDKSKRYVAFTLDDGCRDNAEFAAPVFRKYGVPYTLYITKGLVERTHTMWWETAEVLTRAVDQFQFDFGDGPEAVTCSTHKQKHAVFLRIAQFIESMDEDATVNRLNEAAIAHGVDPMKIIEDEVMNADELRELAKDPLASFGAHTVSHCCLTRLDAARLDREMADCIEAIKEWTQTLPVSIAYPYGWKRACGPREAKAARRAGLRIGVTTQPDVLINYSQDEWMLLPRISLNGFYQKRRYVAALLSGVPFRLM
ncbi:polysaccharide deacetylase family protein [Ahrensia sp. 13_GOM-1096m]|uniref:polysaccharide deacetylase family protein n=1 Tax=Ahrensia sp. 13_GOM-1096m TaxID=1380380 RepID=UPI00047CBF07|nr:polysaccharide deacetylase family protein [Ahrensia sp. 13_GOM-1096m]